MLGCRPVPLLNLDFSAVVLAIRRVLDVEPRQFRSGKLINITIIRLIWCAEVVSSYLRAPGNATRQTRQRERHLGDKLLRAVSLSSHQDIINDPWKNANSVLTSSTHSRGKASFVCLASDN